MSSAHHAQRPTPFTAVTADDARSNNAEEVTIRICRSRSSVRVPSRMRTRFLEDSSQLPPSILQHLEKYIPPTASTSPPPSPPNRKPSPTANSTTSSHTTLANMDMAPDFIRMDDGDDPQRESSTAAACRTTKETSDNSSSSSSEGSTISKQTTLLTRAPIKTTTDQVDAGYLPDPDFKAKSTTRTCRWHEITYSSQYTRPVVDLLREILEVRYPERNDDDEYWPLLGTQRRWRCGWVNRLARRCGWR